MIGINSTRKEVSIKAYCMILILLTAISPALAQNYHITDFLPDSLKTWQIYGILNTNVGNSTENYEYELEKNDTESSNLSTELNPELRFRYKIITRRREWFFSSELSSDFIKTKSAQEDKTDQDTFWEFNSNNKSGTSQQYTLYNSFDLTEYFYKQLGVSIKGSIRLTHMFGNDENNYIYQEGLISEGRRKRDYQYNVENTWNQTSSEFDPGFSLGRIYDGNYAAKAEELLIELRRMNCLKRELTPAEFHSLAQRILKYAEQYHYDFRIRRIEALQDIIDYLSSIGAIAENEIPAVLTINDIYVYSPFGIYPRNFGLNFYINAKINSNYYLRQNDESSYTNDFWTTLVGVTQHDSLLDQNFTESRTSYSNKSIISGYLFGASYHKIKSWNFWYNIQLGFVYNYIDVIIRQKKYSETTYNLYPDSINTSGSKTKSNQNNHKDILTTSANLYYQFNSRSILHLPANVSYQFYRYREDLESAEGDTNSDKKRYYETNFSFAPAFTYYLTPKWSITPSVTILLSKNRDTVGKITFQDFRYTLNFSTIYYW